MLSNAPAVDWISKFLLSAGGRVQFNAFERCQSHPSVVGMHKCRLTLQGLWPCVCLGLDRQASNLPPRRRPAPHHPCHYCQNSSSSLSLTCPAAGGRVGTVSRAAVSPWLACIPQRQRAALSPPAGGRGCQRRRRQQALCDLRKVAASVNRVVLLSSHFQTF
jgi:hypothetical protein